MPVPGTQEIRKPLLEIFKDEAPHNFVINELLELIAGKLNAELEEMSSTEKTAFKNNINDAINYLLKNKLLRHPSKTTYLISKTGSEILAEDPEFIDDASLKKVKTAAANKQISEVVAEPPAPEPAPEITKEEQASEPDEKEIENENVEELEEEIAAETEEIDENSDIPVGFDEPEEQEVEGSEDFLEENSTEESVEEVTEPEEQEAPEVVEEIEQPEITEEQPLEAEVSEIDETETPEESSEEIVDEPVQELEPEEQEEQEETSETDDVFFENNETEPVEDDGTGTEDIESEEVENVEEEEIEVENENENEDIEMNESELEDTTLEAAEEAPEEVEEELEEIEDEEESEEASDMAQDFSDFSFEDLVQQYNEKLADGVLTRIEVLHQDNFCILVMDLLSKMGYRVFQTARYTNEAEGSDLIQGIILENKPGMNPIYIQARKLSRSKTVSKADMLDFVNALSEKGGKGMFVTAGNFSKSAEEVARDEGIMLVDGKKLSGLMISNNFCVNTEKVFELKAIDTESFGEYEG